MTRVCKRQCVVNGWFPFDRGNVFLELFSGCGSLTKAVERLGLPVLEPIDYLNGAHCDLRRDTTQDLILISLEKGHIGFVHLCTLCTIWSRARRGVIENHKNRSKEATGLDGVVFCQSDSVLSEASHSVCA